MDQNFCMYSLLRNLHFFNRVLDFTCTFGTELAHTALFELNIEKIIKDQTLRSFTRNLEVALVGGRSLNSLFGNALQQTE